jgi:hypothetical protein
VGERHQEARDQRRITKTEYLDSVEAFGRVRIDEHDCKHGTHTRGESKNHRDCEHGDDGDDEDDGPEH